MTTCTSRAAWGNLLRRLHFYVGLFVGPFIFFAALTGTLYVHVFDVGEGEEALDLAHRRVLEQEERILRALTLADANLRAAGFNVETQLEPRKLAKQLQYADKAGIRFVVIHGDDEAARGVVAVKDLRRGEQFEVAEAELASTLLVEREQLRSLTDTPR